MKENHLPAKRNQRPQIKRKHEKAYPAAPVPFPVPKMRLDHESLAVLILLLIVNLTRHVNCLVDNAYLPKLKLFEEGDHKRAPLWGLAGGRCV